MLGKTRKKMWLLDVLKSDMNGIVVLAGEAVLMSDTKCSDTKTC